MNQELKKWRERSEAIILNSMKDPNNLDAVQNGTMGMPEIVRRRQALISLNNLPIMDINSNCSISNANYSIQTPSQQPKAVKRSHYDSDPSLPSSSNNRSIIQSSSFVNF